MILYETLVAKIVSSAVILHATEKEKLLLVQLKCTVDRSLPPTLRNTKHGNKTLVSMTFTHI